MNLARYHFPKLVSTCVLNRTVPKYQVSRIQTIFFKNKNSVNENEKSEIVKPPHLNEASQNEKNVASNAASNVASNAEPNKDKSKEEILLQANKSLTEKVNEIDDKYKRALAESENMRVRMKRQIEEAKIYGIQGFCKDLLEVADILQIALKSTSKDFNKENFQSLFKGVEMTEQQLQSVFRRHGLTQINPIGEKFNPNEHHAMFEAEDLSKEPGSVSIVSQIGYKLHDRTIRPAMVGVVKAKNPNHSQPND